MPVSKCSHPPECRAQREVEVGRITYSATREMALDAGDPRLEGMQVDGGPSYEFVEVCEKCGAQLE